MKTIKLLFAIFGASIIGFATNSYAQELCEECLENVPADMRDYVNYLEGDINDVNIFNSALPESDINILFNSSFGFNTTYNHNGFTGSEYLVASYPMQSMSGNTLIDFSDNGDITLIETASYTSMGGFTPLFTDSINALTIKKSIPPCPAPSASFSKLFHRGWSYLVKYLSNGSHSCGVGLLSSR